MHEDQFRHPPAEYRPMAMWFLNGRLEEPEVRRQVGAMAAGGVGSIQVAARTGLETPYLSKRWFRFIDLILAESSRHGMPVWLADEYPYPSGASGGEVVLRHPEYRAWQMRAKHVRTHAGDELRIEHPGSVPLRTCAVPVDDGVAQWTNPIVLDAHVGTWQREQVLFQPSQVYLTTERYLSSGPRPTLCWRVPNTAREWEVWLFAVSEITDFKFFGAYVDLCNPKVTERFVATTYQRYLERLPPVRFTQLTGFFVDEAHPQNWSWHLPDYFRRRTGYDLVEYLPALWTDVGPQTRRVRYDYWQSLTELFIDSFHRPIAEWCHTHGVQLSLEVPSLRNVVQRYADIPGIDPGHHKVGVPLDDILARELPSYRGNLTFPASLAAQTNHQRVLDELFHSVGWSLTLQDMKAMLDRAVARGANLFAFHAFCYTISGLRKWDAPPSEFDQNPYWPHFPLLAAYAGRLAYALSRGRRVAPIAVLDPVTSLWTHQDAGGTADETGGQILRDWTSLLRELVAAQRPHDTLDPLLLAEAHIEDGLLRLGQASYELIVLPPLRNLERAAWRKLHEFASRGGTVIAYGSLPDEEIEDQSEVVRACAAAFGSPMRGFVHLPAGDPASLARVVAERLPADLRITLDAGEAGRRQFLLAQRRDGDEDLYFIANSSMDEHWCEVTVRVVRPSTLIRLDLETGDAQILATSAHAHSGRTELRARLHFAPHGAHLLSVSPPAPSDADQLTRRQAQDERGVDNVVVVELPLDQDWHCAPAADNALRLDRFAFTMTDDRAETEADARAALARPDALVIEPRPLINLFHEVSSAGRSWPGGVEAPPVFGAPPRIRLRLPARAWYSTRFEVEHVPAHAVLCIEDASLSGEWAMWLNGRSIPGNAFVPKRRWDNGNREVDLSHLLTAGANELLVSVRATEPWDGLLAATYLLGDFGVRFGEQNRPFLGRPPDHIRWAERHRVGYPYYAGTLHLSRAVSLPTTGRRVRLRLPDPELMAAGVAHLAVNGHALGVRAWAPYAWDVPAPAVRHTQANEVTLSITNTLVELLEGRRYDPTRRQLVPVVEPLA